jgi:hypothetical protein
MYLYLRARILRSHFDVEPNKAVADRGCTRTYVWRKRRCQLTTQLVENETLTTATKLLVSVVVRLRSTGCIRVLVVRFSNIYHASAFIYLRNFRFDSASIFREVLRIQLFL